MAAWAAGEMRAGSASQQSSAWVSSNSTELELIIPLYVRLKARAVCERVTFKQLLRQCVVLGLIIRFEPIKLLDA